ncbi:MAG: 50S ribosome-binding GTPase [Synergistaceae bacterium]|nr:50S ribosome-binding GTPase [Synergistaceae bacterium]MBQ3398406.1 50S ribosome-binding GTPase [Synergistaceae bacterium]MBQ3760202.1 50S ribosome-binding GTPase [Synergistaceae bacterium]MBQ6665163.1 50S ribosome-binding GTPase [Synergistaceae bacterium]MBQ6981653.1 50S ribosome-binding GTPase [Synergistaceae bacterium]
MADNNDIFREFGESIQKSDINETEKKKIFDILLNMRNQKINLMITGGTGVGKSSTINALFGREISRVGIHAEPETMEIKSYELNDKITLWDSPGLGDGKKDPEHARKIVELLHRKDASGAYMIDLVLVLADAASRDLGTTYSLISDVIVPNLGDENDKKTRVIAALNKCDSVMPRHWDYTNSKPDEKLIAELDGRVDTFRRRIKETTGVDVDTMYYSAGYKEDDDVEQERPYNLAKLLSLIVSHTPDKKRLAIMDNVSRNQETWKSNDDKRDYGKDIQESLKQSVRAAAAATAGATAGAKIGAVLGGPVGAAIGGAIGGIVGGVLGWFGW